MTRSLPGLLARTALAGAVRARAAGGGDRGQATVFVVAGFAALWLFAGIVVDGGLALAGKARALDVAQEAARAGAQQLDVDALRRSGDIQLAPDEAAAAARTYVTSTGDRGTAQVKGDTVTVRVTHHQHTQILRILGLNTLTVHATGAAHAERSERKSSRPERSGRP